MPSSPASTATDRDRFAALCQRLGLTLDTQHTYDDLVQGYQTPPRAYHDLTHVVECLAELDTARHLARDPDAMEMAIWYHDAILDNQQADNEQKSAQLARDVLLGSGSTSQITSTLCTKAQHDKTWNGQWNVWWDNSPSPNSQFPIPNSQFPFSLFPRSSCRQRSTGC